MIKNTASQKLTVIAFADAGHATLDAGEVVTGDAAQISCKVEQDDDGTQTATNDVAPTEVEDGQYRFDLTQAETNGDKLTFYPQSSTAGVQVVALPSNVIYTRPPNFSTLNLTASGNVGIDWANVENPTTALDLSGTDIQLCDTTTTNTDMRGTDSAALASVCTEVRLAALTDWIDGGRLDALLDALIADVGTAGAGLTNITLANDLSATMKTSVQTAVDAAIDTAIAELGVAAPTATPSIRTGIMLMYMALRNKLVVQTSGTDALEVYNDAGTKIASKALTDDGSDYTEAEMVSG